MSRANEDLEALAPLAPRASGQSDDGSQSRSMWQRLRASRVGEACDECRTQAPHTALVLLVMIAFCVPMLAAQVALKNWAAAHESDPRPDLDPLNRTLPDVLLNHWPRNTVSYAYQLVAYFAY